ncbi:MAG TPA: lysophospholipid acyltransferase family protein [Anaerolineae bacterium]|nr:lysophospholipid acyltransferase family protein [Anaerolineae bacterium]
MGQRGQHTEPAIEGYDHSDREKQRRLLHWAMRAIGHRFVYKVDRVEGLENLPAQGPAILMMNHISLIDPVVLMSCVPRHIIPIAKAEGFRNPLFGPVMNAWRVIPIHRGDVDRQALRRMLQVLEAGECLLMAPEGTRRRALQQPRPGVAYVAWRSGAPVIPVALEGTDRFPTLSLARWRRPGATVCLGTPFRYKRLPGRPGHDQLQRMMDEAMYVLAAMLPASRRGEYADLARATSETIEFLPRV